MVASKDHLNARKTDAAAEVHVGHHQEKSCPGNSSNACPISPTNLSNRQALLLSYLSPVALHCASKSARKGPKCQAWKTRVHVTMLETADAWLLDRPNTESPSSVPQILIA